MGKFDLTERRNAKGQLIGYQKTIGKYADENGTIRPKIWYFPADQKLALDMLRKQHDAWEQILAQPPEPIGVVSDRTTTKGGQELRVVSRTINAHVWPSGETAETILHPTPDPDTVTIGTIQAAYADELKQRVGLAGRRGCTPDYYNGQSLASEYAVEFLGKNKPLNELTKNDAQRCVNHFLSRPTLRNGKQIAESYAIFLVKALKAFLLWLERNDNYNWVRFKGFDHLFAVGSADTTEPNPLAVEELKQIVGHEKFAPNLKMWVLLGLNCGFTQVDCASLLRSQLITENGQMYFYGPRKKNIKRNPKARFKIRLWPEVQTMIRQRMAPSGEYVFTNAKGECLQHACKSTNINNVKDQWLHFTRTTKHPDWNFKRFRKTGATELDRIGGYDVARYYLRRSMPSVDAVYIRQAATKVETALMKWRDELLAAGIL